MKQLVICASDDTQPEYGPVKLAALVAKMDANRRITVHIADPDTHTQQTMRQVGFFDEDGFNAIAFRAEKRLGRYYYNYGGIDYQLGFQVDECVGGVRMHTFPY